MPPPPCWRCSSKPHILFYPSVPVYRPASFTTSAVQGQRRPPVPTNKSLAFKRGADRSQGPRKGVKATFIKRKSERTKHKKPAVGERLALRKRIVLSNNNAIAVKDVPEFGVESIGDEQWHGQVVGLTVPMVGQLRAVNAFKRTQNWGLFRNPTMLVRRETVEYGRLFKEMSKQPENPRTIRRILVGERGSGKSMMLLQAMTMAFLNNWVVINLPEAQDIVIAHTEYGPIPGSSPPLYQQKVYTASLLAAIERANPVLSTLTLQVPPPTTPTPIQPSITLDQLALLGAADPEIAYDVFKTLVQDLLLPWRPPLLLCIDGLAHAMKLSAYRNAAFTLIHAHDLAILKWFMGHLSGATELPNGGMVLAATSGSNTSPNLSLDTALQELESLQSQTASLQQGTETKISPKSNESSTPSLDTATEEPESSQSEPASPAQESIDKNPSGSDPSSTPSSPNDVLSQPTPFHLPLYQPTSQNTFIHHPGRHNPFAKYDPRVLDIFFPSSRPGGSSGIQVQRLKGLSRAEARGLMEYWAKSGLLRKSVDETLLGEKWALSGGGVVGELERASFSMMI